MDPEESLSSLIMSKDKEKREKGLAQMKKEGLPESHIVSECQLRSAPEVKYLATVYDPTGSLLEFCRSAGEKEPSYWSYTATPNDKIDAYLKCTSPDISYRLVKVKNNADENGRVYLQERDLFNECGAGSLTACDALLEVYENFKNYNSKK